MAEEEVWFWPAYLNIIIIWNDCWEVQRTCYDAEVAKGDVSKLKLVIIRPQQCDYLVMWRCSTLVWPHCQTWFHPHHRAHNDGSAPLMRHTGLTRCSPWTQIGGQSDPQPALVDWMTRFSLQPVSFDKGWHVWCASGGGRRQEFFFKRELTRRDTMATGGLSLSWCAQWAAEVPDFCMNAWCKHRWSTHSCFIHQRIESGLLVALVRT